MPLIDSTLKQSLEGIFGQHNDSPTTVGSDLAQAYVDYLNPAQNAGMGPTISATGSSAAGSMLGALFASYPQSGAQTASQMASAFDVIALSYQSLYQTGPVVAPPILLPQLIGIFSKFADSGKAFAADLTDALHSWTGAWIVTGIIPGAPPIPFSGPLA